MCVCVYDQDYPSDAQIRHDMYHTFWAVLCASGIEVLTLWMWANGYVTCVAMGHVEPSRAAQLLPGFQIAPFAVAVAEKMYLFFRLDLCNFFLHIILR